MFSLQSFLDTVKEKNLNMDAVMVIRNDRILGLHRFSDNIIHNVYSIAKSHTATAIGIAVDEGILNLDDRPVDVLADIMPEKVDPEWANITLYHLLTMTSGHDKAYLMAADRKILRGEKDGRITQEMRKEWLLYAFDQPLVYRAGEEFCYGNLAPYVAGRMLEKVTGTTVCDFLYEKFWKYADVEKPRWDTDLSGHTFTASDLYLDIADMAKLGQLYAGGGVYKGKRILSEEWVRMAGTRHVDSTHINPAGNARDEEAGYGFYFWINQGAPDSYRCYGREGQFVIILPEKNAVIATQAHNSDVQPVLDVIWDTIFPQL